jgi:hypothetical protein
MKNKIKITAILLNFLLLGFSVKAQSFKLKDLNFIFRQEYAKLKEQHIDTILAYRQYSEGSMVLSVPSRCTGFIEAFILWKSKGKYYLKRVVCYGEPSEKVMEISSKPFDAYLKDLPNIRKREKYKYNGEGLLPTSSHDCFEQITLLSPKINYQITISEAQKKSNGWEVYSWMRGVVNVIGITRAEIDKAIAQGLSTSTP